MAGELLAQVGPAVSPPTGGAILQSPLPQARTGTGVTFDKFDASPLPKAPDSGICPRVRPLYVESVKKWGTDWGYDYTGFFVFRGLVAYANGDIDKSEEMLARIKEKIATVRGLYPNFDPFNPARGSKRELSDNSLMVALLFLLGHKEEAYYLLDKIEKSFMRSSFGAGTLYGPSIVDARHDIYDRGQHDMPANDSLAFAYAVLGQKDKAKALLRALEAQTTNKAQWDDVIILTATIKAAAYHLVGEEDKARASMEGLYAKYGPEHGCRRVDEPKFGEKGQPLLITYTRFLTLAAFSFAESLVFCGRELKPVGKEVPMTELEKWKVILEGDDVAAATALLRQISEKISKREITTKELDGLKLSFRHYADITSQDRYADLAMVMAELFENIFIFEGVGSMKYRSFFTSDVSVAYLSNKAIGTAGRARIRKVWEELYKSRDSMPNSFIMYLANRRSQFVMDRPSDPVIDRETFNWLVEFSRPLKPGQTETPEEGARRIKIREGFYRGFLLSAIKDPNEPLRQDAVSVFLESAEYIIDEPQPKARGLFASAPLDRESKIILLVRHLKEIYELPLPEGLKRRVRNLIEKYDVKR